jgi:hypothetical protein
MFRNRKELRYQKLSKSFLAVAPHLHVGIFQALSGLLVLANRIGQHGEAVTRVGDGEGQNRDDNHYALEHNELILVAHDLSPPATSQLRDTVDTSDEDARVCNDDSGHVGAEACGVEERHCLGRQAVLATRCAQGVFDEEVAEASKDGDLENDTCNHEVCAHVLLTRTANG